jgi:hypothetical protein
MKVVSSVAGGLAGALSVRLMQEVLRRIDPTAPRIDLLRKQAALKIADKINGKPVDVKNVNGFCAAGDIIGNTLYFSLTAAAGNKAVPVGSLLGLGMGAGALTLPAKLGLNSYFVAGTRKRKFMTMGMYLLGGLVAASVSRCLRKK